MMIHITWFARRAYWPSSLWWYANKYLSPLSSYLSVGFYVWWQHKFVKNHIFLWISAPRDFIPTPVNLSKHHVSTEGMHHFCKFYHASTSQCLLFCQAVRLVWKNTPFWSCLISHRQASFLECDLFILKIFKQEEFECFVILCWAVWCEICMISHDSPGKKQLVKVASTTPKPFHINWMWMQVLTWKVTDLVLGSWWQT